MTGHPDVVVRREGRDLSASSTTIVDSWNVNAALSPGLEAGRTPIEGIGWPGH
jgi:hypothetical protein